MTSSLFEAAFAHHVWATLRLIDACSDLSAEALGTDVAGTRGPILDTFRHLVESDAFDLFVLSGDRADLVDAAAMSLADLRAVMEHNGSGWTKVISGPLDPDAVIREVDEDDGFQRWAPVGYRLAGTLEHGTDHRSQIATGLTTLGVQPPKIAVFDFGVEEGRIKEQMPGA
jgi:uncharacterized damage-inducible protein DinB